MWARDGQLLVSGVDEHGSTDADGRPRYEPRPVGLQMVDTTDWSAKTINPRLVPGVLFSSHKFVEDKPHIADVAPTILNLFGLPLPSHFDGKAWNLAG